MCNRGQKVTVKSAKENMHPLNVRRHYHVGRGLIGYGSESVESFTNKDKANAYARECAKNEHKTSGQPYQGGCFGSNGLAYYIVGSVEYVEVKACEKLCFKKIKTKVKVKAKSSKLTRKPAAIKKQVKTSAQANLNIVRDALDANGLDNESLNSAIGAFADATPLLVSDQILGSECDDAVMLLDGLRSRIKTVKAAKSLIAIANKIPEHRLAPGPSRRLDDIKDKLKERIRS